MSALTIPGMDQMQPQAAQQPATPPPTNVEPTSSDPQTKTPEERQKQEGVNDADKDNLIECRRRTLATWSQQRRIIVTKDLRRVEYVKGHQYYVEGPTGYNFVDPFAVSGASGNEQANSVGDITPYVTNIIQWLDRVFTYTLSATVPRTRYQPTNAQSDLGNRVANSASRANAYIERLNDIKSLLKSGVSYFSRSGSYFKYTRFVRDNRLSGGRMETVPVEEMGEVELSPNRFICPRCVASNPADPLAAASNPQCQQCGSPLSNADFHRAARIPGPKTTTLKQCPEGQVRQTVFNSAYVNADPAALGVPTIESVILDLSMEMGMGALKGMFPQLWDLDSKQNKSNSASAGDQDNDRQMRERAMSQSGMATSGQGSGGSYSQSQKGTYSRCWFQPEAFNILEKKEDAERLQALFPDGCCMALVNGQFMDIRAAKMNEEWTWAGTRDDQGLYPPAVLDPAMDQQDRLNDTDQTLDDYYNRLAVFPFFYDSQAIGKGFSGRFSGGGSGWPVHVRKDIGRNLKDVLFQPKMEIDASINQRREVIIYTAQLLTGITPQMYGGTQEKIDTATGQKQALDVAQSIMSGYWDSIRSEHARASKNAVRCLAQNATGDLFDVIKGDDGIYKNQPIDLNALQNEFEAYPESDQGYPISFQEQRQILQGLLESAAKNPIFMEMLGPMKNRRTVARLLLPADMEIPGEKQRVKILQDIARLREGEPKELPDPRDPSGAMTVMMPCGPDGSQIIPDKVVDDLKLTQEVCKEYMTDNYWQLKDEFPQAFQNIFQYLVLAVQFDTENQQLAQANAAATGGAPPGSPPSPGSQA